MTRESSAGFLNSIAIVLTGSIAAQAIPLLVMPLLTRLVAPAQMGLYSTWFGIMAILSIVATFRFEILLTIERDPVSRHTCLVVVSSVIPLLSILFGFALLGATPWMRDLITGWHWSAALSLTIGIWALSMNKVWLALAVNTGHFRTLGIIRVATAACCALLQLAAVTVLTEHGLEWGYATGLGVGVVIGYLLLMRRVPSYEGGSIDLAGVKAYVRQKMQLPLNALPADLINALAQQLPILFVTGRFGASAAGVLALSIRVLDAPAGVFSSSVLDVYKQRAADEFSEHGNCRRTFLETLRMLMVVALIPSTIVLAAGPYLFALVFGEQWRESGLVAQILAPMAYLRFFASPLGYTLYICDKARQQLYWQIALLVLSTLAFILPETQHDAFVMYASTYGGLYVVYLLMSYRAACGTPAPRADSLPGA